MGGIFSKPPYSKPVIDLRERTIEHKSQEQIDKEKIEKETRKKFEDLTIWVVDKIRKSMIHNRKDEIKIELPIESILPKNYPQYIPVNTYLFFKVIRHNNEGTQYYEPSFYISEVNSLNKNPLFVLFYETRKRCNYSMLWLDINRILSNIEKPYMDFNIYCFLKEIYQTINNLYIDTYEECFQDSENKLYGVRTSLFETTSNVIFKSVNICKICNGKTKNTEYCYFCKNNVKQESDNPRPVTK